MGLKAYLIRMPPELYAEITDEARRQERSIAQTIRRAIKYYLQAPPSVRR